MEDLCAFFVVHCVSCVCVLNEQSLMRVFGPQGARVVVSRSFADFTPQATFDIKVGRKTKIKVEEMKLKSVSLWGTMSVPVLTDTKGQ